MPTEIINWIIDFLSHRSQRIKLSEGCYSEWGSVPSGVPQGTKLGPWLFLVLINDLEINNAGNIWKYVDDTTTSEIVVKGASSNSQLIADTVVQWSFENRVKLNSEKCKELRISFPKNKPQLAPGPSCYNLRCNRRLAIPKCKTECFKNSFLVRSCIDNEF